MINDGMELLPYRRVPPSSVRQCHVKAPIPYLVAATRCCKVAPHRTSYGQQLGDTSTPQDDTTQQLEPTQLLLGTPVELLVIALAIPGGG